MNRADAVQRSGRSQRTIFRWIKSGRLRTTRVPCEYYPYWRYDISIDAIVDAIDAEVSTTCRNGHERTEENTVPWGPGRSWRRCRDCCRERNRALYWRDKGLTV